MARRLVGFAIVSALLAGCQSTQAPSTAPVSEEAYLASAALSETIRACWFAGDEAFADYVYAPEVNAGVPRILIVRKNEPGGRPALVIEPKGQALIDTYGPLLASDAGPRIRADLERWKNGSEACA